VWVLTGSFLSGILWSCYLAISVLGGQCAGGGGGVRGLSVQCTPTLLLWVAPPPLLYKSGLGKSKLWARNKRHPGDAPSSQPIVAGLSPQRNVGTLK